MSWNGVQVETELRARGLQFHQRSILHGRAYDLLGGEVITVRPDGSVELGGIKSPLEAELRAIFSHNSMHAGR